MKRLVIFAIGVVSVATVWAEWRKLGTTEQGNVVWYMESQSLEVVGVNVRRARFLYDDIKGGRSVMIHDEFNCKVRNSRTIRAVSYSGLLAKGKIVVEVNEPTKWEPVVAGSTNDKLIQIACK